MKCNWCLVEYGYSHLMDCFWQLFTSAEEGGYVFGAVCFSSVCLSVCPSDYSQT